MNAIIQCITMTEQLIHEANAVTQSNRDEVITKIEQLLDERSKLLPLIKGPYTAEEKVEGAKLLSLNEKMEHVLKNMHTHIKKDINELNVKRKSVNHYRNPYAATTHLDGAFYDQRK